MKSSFSSALGKDRLYQRPVGFMQDQQIWMVGVLSKYFVKHCLHFDHADFMKAIRQDVSPILGELGAWVLTNYVNRQREKGRAEKKKQGQVALELVKNFLENGFDQLVQEKKYYFLNKYSPKKLPALAEKRSSIEHLYSWSHYAPIQWFDHLKKLDDDQKLADDRKKNAHLVKKCSFCSAPESDLRKHKVCSACKSAFYCTGDCQKYDWQKKHKAECKDLAAKYAILSKKGKI